MVDIGLNMTKGGKKKLTGKGKTHRTFDLHIHRKGF